MPAREVTIRPGSVDDLPAAPAMFDSAVAWLVANGRGGQWGTRPWSSRPTTVTNVGKMMRQGSPWIAEVDGEPAGTIALSPAPMSEYPVETFTVGEWPGQLLARRI